MTDQQLYGLPNNAEYIERAKESDPDALWRLYGQAAAFLRDGAPMPDDLGPWLAERLEALAKAVRATKGKAEAERDKSVMKALQVRRAVRGRRPAVSSKGREVLLAEHVLSMMLTRNLRADPACHAVADWFAKERTRGPKLAATLAPVGAADYKAVKTAWDRHGKAVMRKAGVSKRPK